MDIELRALSADDLPLVHSLLEDSCPYDEAADVAEEKLFGPAPAAEPPHAIGAFSAGPQRARPPRRHLAGVAASSRRWIRLLAVHPDDRGRGVGTALLTAAENRIAARGEAHARTLDQPGNYLAPGIDARNQATIAWFERRGYRRLCENANLLLPVLENPRVSPARAAELARRAAEGGYLVRRAREADRGMLGAEIARAFSPSWAFEVDRALDRATPAVHMAVVRDGGQLAAFAAHDGNNGGLGWFGPAGTLEPHRSRGLGEALLLACLLDVAAAGHQICTIAWIGPRAFYERAAGPPGPAGAMDERRFVVLGKQLAEARGVTPHDTVSRSGGDRSGGEAAAA